MKKLLFVFLMILGNIHLFAQTQQPLIVPDDSIRSLLGRILPNTDPNLSSHMNLQFCTAGMANFTDRV